MKRCLAEFFGTFALVFAGTGVVGLNPVSGGTITHVGIALTFGLVVLAMIYTFGDISSAAFQSGRDTWFLVGPPPAGPGGWPIHSQSMRWRDCGQRNSSA